MKNIVVIFGGRTVEHDISILTGLHAAKHVTGHKVLRVYLTKDNVMTMYGKKKPIYFSSGKLNNKIKIDCVINCCHGGVGEGGELAGYFETAGIPITSCNPYTAHILQSKTKTREVLSSNEFIQPEINPENFPMIVKPDSLGSSIGISVAKDEYELNRAIDLAKSMDNEIIIEEYLKIDHEINCSAMRVGGEIVVSDCEEIKNDKNFLDYNTKYLDSSSGFIKKGGKKTKIPHEKEIKELTKKAYELFNCQGVIRADFIISNNLIHLNEINTVPGFLAYHLWARSGVPYGVLLNDLINESIANAKKTVITEFKSDILSANSHLLS